LPAGFGNRKTLWRRTLCRAADYAPATFLLASATFLLSFLPCAHAFSEFFSLNNGVRNEKLISDTLWGLIALPQSVLQPDRSLVIWFLGAAALAGLAVFIVGRSIYRRVGK